MKIIYEAFFIAEPKKLESIFPAVHPNRYYHHSTIAFKPSALSFPERLGEDVLLKIIGRLTSDEVDVLVVESPFPAVDVEWPHITLSTAIGVPPRESKTALKNRAGHLIGFFDAPKFISARYGYFDGNQEVFSISEVPPLCPECGIVIPITDWNYCSDKCARKNYKDAA